MENKVKYLKLFLFFVLVVPFAFIWDCVFGLFNLLHKGLVYVDDVGGKFLEDLKDKLMET